MAYFVPPATITKEEQQQIDLDRLKTEFTNKLAMHGIEEDGLASDLVQLVIEEQHHQQTLMLPKEDGRTDISDDGEDQVIRIFGPGHLSRLSTQFGIEHTFAIPLMTSIATSGDAGIPFILRYPDSPQAAIFKELASSVVREIAKLKYNNSALEVQIQFDAEQHVLKVISPSSSRSDGSAFDFIKPATLRRDCKCAACVEEMSGRQILQPQSVSEMIKPTSMQPCGNYALSVVWSDGHRSLYPYRQIRGLVSGNKMTTATRPSTIMEKKEVFM
jgi:DUF971 family protein